MMMRIYLIIGSLLLITFAYAQYKGYSAFGDEGKRGTGTAGARVFVHHK